MKTGDRVVCVVPIGTHSLVRRGVSVGQMGTVTRPAKYGWVTIEFDDDEVPYRFVMETHVELIE